MSIVACDDVYLRGSFVPTAQNLNDDIDAEEYRGMRSGVYPPMFHYLASYGIYVMRFLKNF
jgi:hypothetical protein